MNPASPGASRTSARRWRLAVADDSLSVAVDLLAIRSNKTPGAFQYTGGRRKQRRNGVNIAKLAAMALSASSLKICRRPFRFPV
jgi:hypothetical protein